MIDPRWAALLDGLTVAEVVADADGTIAHANAAVTALLGWDPADLVGQPVTTLVPRRMLGAHRAGFSRWATTGALDLAGTYLRVPGQHADGHEVALGMVLSPLEHPGEPPLVLALIRPRDQSDEAVNAVALELVSVLSRDLPVDEVVHGLLRAIGERLTWDVTTLWVVDPDRNKIRAVGLWDRGTDTGQAFRDATRAAEFVPGEGLPGRVWATGAMAIVDDVRDDPNFPRTESAREAGLVSAFAFPVEHDGELLGVIEMYRTRSDPIDAQHPTVLAGIGTHLGRYLDHALANERRARFEARQRIIARANALLAHWLDYPTPMDDLCGLLVPEVAEICVIDLVEESQLTRVGQAYVDPEYGRLTAELEDAVPLGAITAGPMAVIRTGETLVYEEITADEMAAGLPDTVPRELLDALTPSSSLIVPLIGRGATIGTLSVSRRGGRFDDDDRRFAEEFGRHVGLAVANAQLFEREHAIAAALQQSLLPPTLPEIPGLEIAARYEPGGTRLTVGGDFYDLFPIGDGRWYAMVGDVCGTGAEAAAITSQVRYTARALAERVGGPSELLVEVNTALLQRGDTRFCTALAAQLVPADDGLHVTLASGGHPPPVLISRHGTRLVDCRGTLLGVYEDVEAEAVELVLREGEALAMYTDGVTESRDPEGQLLGEDRLVELLDACVDEHAEKTATQLIEVAVQHAAFGPADDIVVLVVRHA